MAPTLREILTICRSLEPVGLLIFLGLALGRAGVRGSSRSTPPSLGRRRT